MDIQPGQTIMVEVSNPPRSAAAEKTLYRVLYKDPSWAKARRIQKEKRPSVREWRRGGRWWTHRMKTRPAFALAPGEKFQLRATLDVIRDLKSVARHVSVAPVAVS